MKAGVEIANGLLIEFLAFSQVVRLLSFSTTNSMTMESPQPYSPPFTRKKRRESLLPAPPNLSLGPPKRKRARVQPLHCVGEEDECSSTSSDDEEITEPIVLAPALLNEKVMELFGLMTKSTGEGSDESTPSTTIAASLFASFAILREKTIQSLSPILPFLNSLVHIEKIFNGETPENKRKVRFASIDGSCILPPVDRDPDSMLPQQGAIEALQIALESVLALSPASKPLLEELVNFLDSNSETDQVVDLKAVIDCSRRQFRAHVSTYRDDVRIIINRLSRIAVDANTPMKHAALRSIKDSPLKSVEVLLADRIGSAIRYHLRMLFNKVPPSISSKTVQPQLERYSRICEIVSFHGYETNSDVIISSLISRSLRVLFDTYGIAALMGQESISLPADFFTSKSSTLKIPKKGNPGVCTNEDFENVEKDVLLSLEFVESSRACRFLVDLWSYPGVSAELERLGGLDQVETYASMSWNYDLYTLRPEDAHLMALCNISELMSRLGQWKLLMKPLEEAALEGAQTIAKHYRFSTKSKRILSAYPLIKHLKSVYDETMLSIEEIPMIVTTS